ELTFYDLLDQLHTGHDAPSVEEALEAEHWTHAAFYPPMILFDNIVQVGASADLDRISQLACECRIGVGIQTEASPKRTIPSNDCFLLLFRDLRTLNLKSVSHFCATRSATDATMLHTHLCSTPSAFGRLASAHKCLRICDLCKELAFGTQRELSQVAIHTTRSCSPCYDASSWREVLRKGRSVFSTGDMLILARGAQICNTLIVSTLASCPKLPATVPDLPKLQLQLRELKLDDIELEEGRPRTEAYIVYLFLMLRGLIGGCKDQHARLLQEESITLKLWLNHLGLELPPASTLSENLNAVSNQTRGPIHQVQLRYIFQQGLDDFQKCFIDSTAV